VTRWRPPRACARSKGNPQLVIKSGFLEGKPLTAAEVQALADLEPREVLLAKMAGALKGSLNRAAYVFNAPLSKAARTVDALRAKVEAGAPAPAPSDEAAAPAATDEAPAAAAADEA